MKRCPYCGFDPGPQKGVYIPGRGISKWCISFEKDRILGCGSTWWET